MSQVASVRALCERLYARLPVIYRLRDAQQGEPLRALLSLLEEELSLIESDIARLYDNWFIETCDEWAVPYLGDVIGARLRHAVNARAFTANTLGYRRRKGTLATLPALAQDVTGWPAHAVEYQSLVVTSQHINSPRPLGLATTSLHRLDALDRIGTPFEQTQRSVDVRARGRFHPEQLGLYVFRTSVLSQQRAVALPATELLGCFHVGALGQPHSLYVYFGTFRRENWRFQVARNGQGTVMMWLFQTKTGRSPYFPRAVPTARFASRSAYHLSLASIQSRMSFLASAIVIVICGGLSCSSSSRIPSVFAITTRPSGYMSIST